MRALALSALATLTTPAFAETVDVKYRGPVNLKPFVCHDVTRSSFIRRVCYDAREQYMLLRLNETYYAYCEIGKGVVDEFEAAPSMGRYYNKKIKGTGKDGPFDCRTHRMPSYRAALPDCPASFVKAWDDRGDAALPKPPRPCILHGEHDAYVCSNTGCVAR